MSGFLFVMGIIEQDDLHRQIDECLAREDYHRDMLLLWKQTRVSLERRIHDDDAVPDMLQVAEDEWQRTQKSQT